MQMLDEQQAVAHWKARGLDFSKLFHKPAAQGQAIFHSSRQDHGLEKVLDRKLIAAAKAAIETGAKVTIETAINNTDRATGAMLSGEIARRYGHAGLPVDTIHIRAKGTAGQSFGAWLAAGVTLELEGQANDYVGKGLSGGRIIVYPPASARITPEKSIIIGNTALYGAISGECYFRGVAGERFAVRNSGAIAVVEGARRPRLRIYDRRHRRRHRRDGAQFRGRHVRRHRLCPRRGRQIRRSAAISPWSN